MPEDQESFGTQPVLPVLVDCEDCGACCRHMIVPPFRIDVDVDEPAQRGVPQSLLDELLPLWQVRYWMPESACLWYDEELRKCRHYELRPQACRDFEINTGSCLACRDKWGMGKDSFGEESSIQ